MQNERNCHRHIWLLSGTGEGPVLAKALIEDGWKVTVSVVSFQASLAYEGISLDDLRIGSLGGVQGIIEFIREAKSIDKIFDWVVDATHPFAEIISSSLKIACLKLEQPLLRYERPMQVDTSANFISSFRELASFDLSNQKLLLAIGSRHLKEAVLFAQQSGANVFVRVLPTAESLKNALKTSLPSSNIALMRPNLLTSFGELELALCERWNITSIICRQSGGQIETLWRQISQKRKLQLWMISRPVYLDGVQTINNYEELLQRVSITSVSKI